MRRAVFVMTICFGLLVTLYLFAVCTAAGQRFDDHALLGPVGCWQRVAAEALDTITAWSVTPTVLVLGGLAWRRGGRSPALAVTGMVLMAIGAVYLLQHVLPRPALLSAHHGASFPSGHAAVGTAVMCGLLLIVPDRYRDRAAVPASLCMSAVSALTVVARWHRPSDTVGSALIVLIFAAAAVALLIRSGHVRTTPIRPAVLAALGAQVLVAAAFTVWDGGGTALTFGVGGLTTLAMLALLGPSRTAKFPSIRGFTGYSKKEYDPVTARR